jgi:hypothetical protein
VFVGEYAGVRVHRLFWVLITAAWIQVNIGRINTTFACESMGFERYSVWRRFPLRTDHPRVAPLPLVYPEMRTILRAYHSVPSLQNTVATRKSMQGERLFLRTTAASPTSRLTRRSPLAASL